VADLSDLRRIPAARARLDADELALIDKARRAGATWADIATALGLASRQAAEQRRLRLATAAAPCQQDLDEAIAGLRVAAVELHRRVGADRRWDGRFVRARLVRETLDAAVTAPSGPMFSLVNDVVGDLDVARVPLPGPMRAAIGRLREAYAAATPHP